MQTLEHEVITLNPNILLEDALEEAVATYPSLDEVPRRINFGQYHFGKAAKVYSLCKEGSKTVFLSEKKALLMYQMLLNGGIIFKKELHEGFNKSTVSDCIQSINSLAGEKIILDTKNRGSQPMSVLYIPHALDESQRYKANAEIIAQGLEYNSEFGIFKNCSGYGSLTIREMKVMSALLDGSYSTRTQNWKDVVVRLKTKLEDGADRKYIEVFDHAGTKNTTYTLLNI